MPRFAIGRWWPGTRRRPAAPAHPLKELDDNDVRQCLRVAFGSTLGFTISNLFGWNYGVFFTVYPMLLLALVPTLNGHVVRQFLGSALINTVEVALIAGLFSHLPLVMTCLAFILFAGRFRLMSGGPLFLFGAQGMVSLSVMFHFASYPSTDLHDMLASNLVASSLTVAIASVVYVLIPDAEPRRPPPRRTKSLARQRHETLLGASVATLSFVVFQVFDLRDSLSAQVATILILFPLTFDGAVVAARHRATGVLLGCSFGLLVQLVLYNHSGNLWLVVLPLWIGIMLFAREHLKEGVGSGAGFGGMTTVGILFGQYLSPGQDLVYSDLYRFSSICVGMLVTLLVAYLVHRLLNRFPATRLVYEDAVH
ncbi:DUF2955 domain-containing protein [Modicisalibacter coralii]|uniref:DUF2955 domain-containing protein n=1 Tax=Modicisalibacter coralii TaxID=2304602 RepID=UPI00100A6580|nr:DUF2955 domain-containing protein [Halomonas coralii]